MVIVYTAILGGCDSLKPAPAGADRCVCFVNDASHVENPRGWDVQLWKQHGWTWTSDDSRREAWRLRCVPHTLFTSGSGWVQYDTVVWVDASFTVTDLPRLLRDAEGHWLSGLRHHKRHSAYTEAVELVRNGQSDAGQIADQVYQYKREGFDPNELTISCVLVRQNNARVTAFNETWDAEIRKHPGDNTQVSIDYAAWKHGLSWHHLEGVRKNNPYAVHDHADHKRRRKPYR